mmetsp:Transcript_10247/g.26088  ORF Transcript_10247/g.26088 Transcript_10247/m.26088 type:complete len:574 (+) Transcript_10247:269-1990(+)
MGRPPAAPLLLLLLLPAVTLLCAAERQGVIGTGRPKPGVTAPLQAAIPAVVQLVATNGSSLGSVWASAALFGAPLPLNGTEPLQLEVAQPLDACADVARRGPPDAGLLVARGTCGFADKAINTQAAGASLMLLVSNTSDCLVMDAPDARVAGNLSALYAISVDVDVGEYLQSMMAAEPRLRVVVWGVSAEMDASSALLWLMAVATVAVGSVWSARDAMGELAHAGEPSVQAAVASEGHVPAQPLTEAMAAGFIVMASVMLLLLSWLMGWLVMLLLVVGFALVSWQALSMLLLPVVASAAPALKGWAVALPGWAGGRMRGHELAACLLGLAVVAVWLPSRHMGWAWALQDAMGLSLCILFLRQIVLPNLKVALILLPMAFCYDVFWVFLQPLLTHGESAMVRVATGGGTQEAIPMVIRVPRLFSDLPGYSLLGLGDIVLPGLLVAFTRLADLRLGLLWPRGYFAPVLTGYGVGLLLTYLALMFHVGGSHGQPALLYLVPCTLGPLCGLAAARGHFRLLLRGKFPARAQGGADTEAPPATTADPLDWSRDSDEDGGWAESSVDESESLMSRDRQA